MNVSSHMSVLESAGLVGLAQVMPDVEYLFRHTLVQEVAYSSLLDQDQKRLHLQVGEAIEALYPERLDELAPTLARHFEQAGEGEKAASYYTRAARIALDAYAHQEAQQHFINALRLTLPPDLRAGLLAGLGEAYFQDSRFDDSIQRWKEAIYQYQQVRDLDNTARLYARASRAAWFNGNHPLGLTLCLDGMEALGKVEGSPYPLESYGMALLIHETARAYYFNGQLQQSLKLCREALAMSERLNATDVLADSLTTLGIIPTVPIEERLAALTRAVELAEAAGALQVAGRAHFNLGGLKSKLSEQWEEGLSHYQKAADIARRTGMIQQEIFYRSLISDIKIRQGKYVEAEQIISELEEKQKGLTDPGASEMELRMLRAVILRLHGYLEEAIQLISDSLAIARQRGNLEGIANCLYNLAFLYKEQYLIGQTDNMDRFTNLLPEFTVVNQMGLGSPAMFASIQAVVEACQGNFTQAHQYLANAYELIKQEEHMGEELDLLIIEADIARLEMDWQRALDNFEKIKTFRPKLDPWTWARLVTEAAKSRLGRGEPDDLEEAQGMLLEAQEIFQNIRAPLYQKYVEQLLQASRQQTHAQAAAQRLVTQELAQAGRLQNSFLPVEPPKIPGWQIASLLRPARQTTGDYYDFIPLPDGRLGMVIADVADKGMGAALFMASSRTLLRAFATENADAPDQALLKANQHITQDTHGGLFVTLFYGILNPSTGQLVYCNAGHNPPYLITSKGETHSLVKTGIPLGIFEDASWQVRSINLAPQDTLVLYTDGVTEATGPGDTFFGDAHLLQVIQQASLRRSAQHTLQSILGSVDSFRGKIPQSDDITLVVTYRS